MLTWFEVEFCWFVDEFQRIKNDSAQRLACEALIQKIIETKGSALKYLENFEDTKSKICVDFF